MRKGFLEQARLMLRALPHVAAEESFGLKGGTALNFFVWDMPRLSVDIDLTYLPIQPRAESLRGISDALLRMCCENLNPVRPQGILQAPYLRCLQAGASKNNSINLFSF